MLEGATTAFILGKKFDDAIRIAPLPFACHAETMNMFDIERAWKQIQQRDASAEERFVYAVRTTGIYCRPSCPSRRPARRNVVLYGNAAEAKAAGFRACMRCRPDGEHPHAARLAAICRLLDQEHEKAPVLDAIAAECGLSPSAVQRLFRHTLGVTPHEYLEARKIQRLQSGLLQSSSVTEAIYDAGYGSASRVYERSQLGMSPGSYRARGQKQNINYTTASSPLGRMLVAATDRGVCAVAFGDNDEDLVAALRDDLCEATITRSNGTLADQVCAVLATLTEHPVSTALALDVRQTAFQRRVWNALRQIPRGETRSYGEVARAIGSPEAVRAVARACSQNPVAVLVPCHRVIGKNGALTGYRWGIERKAKLLEIERQTALRGPE